MERNFTRFIFCIPFFVFFISCARGKSGECKIESDPFNKVMVDGAKIVVFDAQAEIPDYLNLPLFDFLSYHHKHSLKTFRFLERMQ